MTEIEELLASEIRLHGRVSFARFMEVALYCPVYGFYEKEPDTIGRRGHFFTSVSVGPLFGHLLAFQFASWIEQHPVLSENPVLIEAGAHDGKLAGDILGWFEHHRPALHARLRYVILDPSVRRQAWQADTLASRAPKVTWANDLDALTARELSHLDGIIFANEFLDAFPIRRVSWDRAERAWKECGVTLVDERFEWCRMDGGEEIRPFLPPPGDARLEHLPDGYIMDVSPAAFSWWQRAALSLRSGMLLTIDYGLCEEDRFSPARTDGTLRAYYRHQCAENLLEDPGGRDLTAHVDFPLLVKAGEQAGLLTRAFQTQGRYLASLASQIPPGSTFAPPWEPKRVRQFNTLTHPAYLGQVFKVLVQEKKRPPV